MTDWEQVACWYCNGDGWKLVGPDYQDGHLCKWCGGRGKVAMSKELAMDTVKQFASYLLAHWTIISGVAVGGLTWATTGNSQAFWSAVAAGLVAHGGATAGANAAIKAHYAKKTS